MPFTNEEKQANVAVISAREAIQVALDRARDVGYGSHVIGPLDDALRSLGHVVVALLDLGGA